MERLGRPPAWGKWVADQMTDSEVEWSGGFGNLQGSANGERKSVSFEA